MILRLTSSPAIRRRRRSDALPYDLCNRFVQEQGAASYRLLAGASFRAEIDLEPAHIVGEEGDLDPDAEDRGEIPSPAGTCTRRMSWDRSKGFVFAENSICKKAPPRSIKISDDGQITAKPCRRLPTSELDR